MTSHALVPFRGPDSSVPLPITTTRLPDDLQVSQVQVGPGRILHNVYTSIGRSLESTANRMAHRSGLGPIAATKRIEKQFGDSVAIRQEILDRLFCFLNVAEGVPTPEVGSDIKQIKKECQKLMQKYALP